MSILKSEIKTGIIPKHVAIIMDGNGRWAKQQSQERLYGHHHGVNSVREVTEASTELGVEYLTLYTFSTENWSRPQSEVDGLMALLVDNVERETSTFMKNNIRLMTIGDSSRMPQDTLEKLNGCIAQTAHNTGLTLILALSYSSRWELTRAMQQIAQAVERGELSSDDITEETIEKHLSTSQIPDPDLLIRTSGELRISNFLLWQIAYSELYFTPTLWPDFTRNDFYKAILDYQQRERRFGKTSEQIV